MIMHTVKKKLTNSKDSTDVKLLPKLGVADETQSFKSISTWPLWKVGKFWPECTYLHNLVWFLKRGDPRLETNILTPVFFNL